MFILRFLRYLQGYVRFRAEGEFIERFLNLLARDRIAVWDGRKRGNTYTGCARAAVYRKMRRHAKTSGVRLRVTGKSGAPFTRRKYRHRKGVLVGALVFFAFIFVVSGFIWRVEVNGNESVEESHVIAALEEIGVGTGTWRAAIDVREAERRAMLKLPEVAWLALNIKGSTVTVEIDERTPPPPMVDPHKPCNIVAARDGQITSIRVYDGEPLLQQGDTVMKGEIIVSGITEDRMGQNLFRHALADVEAQVQAALTVEVPLAQVEYEPVGETVTRRYLQVFGFDLPLYWPRAVPRPYRAAREQIPFSLFGAALPAGVLREEFTLMREVPVTLTEEQAKERALKELDALEIVEFEGAEFLDKRVTGVLHGGRFVLRAEYVCSMPIGIEQEILPGE